VLVTKLQTYVPNNLVAQGCVADDLMRCQTSFWIARIMIVSHSWIMQYDSYFHWKKNPIIIEFSPSDLTAALHYPSLSICPPLVFSPFSWLFHQSILCLPFMCRHAHLELCRSFQVGWCLTLPRGHLYPSKIRLILVHLPSPTRTRWLLVTGVW